LLRQTGEYALQILKHVVIPEAHHAKFILQEPIVALDIPNGIGVLATVDFDD
jgi:hypothetical protein